MQDCGFTRENKWFRYRAAAIIIEEDCALFAGNEIENYYYSIGGGVHVGETTARRSISYSTPVSSSPSLFTAFSDVSPT